MVDGSKMLAVSLLLSFIFILNIDAKIPRILRGRPKGGMVGVPKWHGKTEDLPSDMWLKQKLDHFNDADTMYWQQRYFVNDTFYKEGGPIFIMIGGEGTANPIWMVEGTWLQYAMNYNAICFTLEHRFYGKSHPTSDLSVENLSYLSSEQALADLAYFITYIRDKYKLIPNKLITLGGSYPGSLSAWFRVKYPHLVDGAVATSAPIFAVLNFVDYLGVVSQALDTTGPMCNKMVSSAHMTVKKLIQTEQGRMGLKKMFKLCDGIDLTDKMDMANFYSSIAGNFEGVVQYNKDNRAFEGAVGTNITVKTLCDIMCDDTRGEAINRYADVNSLLLSTYSEKCLDASYKGMIDDLTKTGWNSSASEGGRQWMYQTCTEFGFYQTSDLTDQPFTGFSLDFSLQQCIDIYGKKFTADLIQKGINRTNTNYGGYGMRPTKVVFPNGSIDPWHALSFTTNVDPTAFTTIYIDGTAHCANMYPPTPSDPPQLIQARKTINTLIGQWISK